MRGLRFAFPKDLRIIATVRWWRYLLDLEGVPSDFRLVLGLLTAARTSLRVALKSSFCRAPLLGLDLNVLLVVRDCRWMNEVIVVYGILIL